jgi:hypothetical protein
MFCKFLFLLVVTNSFWLEFVRQGYQIRYRSGRGYGKPYNTPHSSKRRLELGTATPYFSLKLLKTNGIAVLQFAK